MTMLEWECPECGAENGFWSFTCKECGLAKEVVIFPYEWYC